LQTTIEQVGPLKIGQQATNDSLAGLSAFTHIMRGSAPFIRFPAAKVQPEEFYELDRWIWAFSLALLPVTVFLLNNLNREIPNDQAVHNAQILAQWSRYYGTGTYRMAKRTGVLKVPPQIGKDPHTTDEMLEEADAVIADGLESIDDDAPETW
jgi:hypothetical protein